MSILNPILANIPGASETVESLSGKIGLGAAQTEKVITVLAQTHVATGDTIANAAYKTGLDASVLTQLVSALGGETALSTVASGLSNDAGSLAQGSIIEDIIYMFKGPAKNG
ncbi:MAG: hypothetical protein WBA51_08960 [Erythrobacter sp.]